MRLYWSSRMLDACLSRYAIRCTYKGLADGIEVGDYCEIRNGYYVPVWRYYNESGKSYPMTPIRIEDAEDFKFVKLYETFPEGTR